MYTIFVNENVIYLDEKPANNDIQESLNYNDSGLNEIIKRLENNELKSVSIYHSNLQNLWENFKSHFNIIEAAGGLVLNENNETLWIYRHEKWDLPKGKIEPKESVEEAAIREVEEECGVTNLKLKGLITKTYHVYRYKEKRILKVTYWYEMSTTKQNKLTPQIEEGITKVEWIGVKKLNKVLENTYGNIDLLCKFAIR